MFLYQWLKRRAWMFDAGLWRLQAEPSRSIPGWMPHAFVFCSFGLIIMAWCSLKIPLAWPCALLDIVATLITHVLLKRSVKQLCRMGWLGFSRPRWWIELSAALCTATMGLFVTAMSQVNPVVAPPGIVNAIADFCAHAAVVSGWGFMIAGAIGMLFGQIIDRPVRGHAMELVAATFWFVVFMAAVTTAPDAWTLPIIMGLTLTAILVTLVYYYYERETDQTLEMY